MTEMTTRSWKELANRLQHLPGGIAVRSADAGEPFLYL